MVGCFGCACGSDCCYGGVVVVVAVVVVVVVIGGGVVAVVQSFSIAILATIMAIIRSEV